MYLYPVVLQWKPLLGPHFCLFKNVPKIKAALALGAIPESSGFLPVTPGACAWVSPAVAPAGSPGSSSPALRSTPAGPGSSQLAQPPSPPGISGAPSHPSPVSVAASALPWPASYSDVQTPSESSTFVCPRFSEVARARQEFCIFSFNKNFLGFGGRGVSVPWSLIPLFISGNRCAHTPTTMYALQCAHGWPLANSIV